jgi:hypothetical protein
MQTLAMLTSGLSVLALALAALGINRARSPNGAYGAAALGLAGCCGLVASLAFLRLVAS